jgi:hypothetical protein
VPTFLALFFNHLKNKAGGCVKAPALSIEYPPVADGSVASQSSS